jgi:glutamine synthetase
MAPNINSYKWFANRSVALTVVAWGLGNRTPPGTLAGRRPGRTS